MFVVNPDVIINPLQVESVTWKEASLILDSAGGDDLAVIIRMASGKEYVIDKEISKDVNEAVRQLVFQIDLANGMKIKKDEEEEEVTAVEETPKKKKKVKVVPFKKGSDRSGLI